MFNFLNPFLGVSLLFLFGGPSAEGALTCVAGGAPVSPATSGCPNVVVAGVAQGFLITPDPTIATTPGATGCISFKTGIANTAATILSTCTAAGQAVISVAQANNLVANAATAVLGTCTAVQAPGTYIVNAQKSAGTANSGWVKLDGTAVDVDPTSGAVGTAISTPAASGTAVTGVTGAAPCTTVGSVLVMIIATTGAPTFACLPFSTTTTFNVLCIGAPVATPSVDALWSDFFSGPCGACTTNANTLKQTQIRYCLPASGGSTVTTCPAGGNTPGSIIVTTLAGATITVVTDTKLLVTCTVAATVCNVGLILGGTSFDATVTVPQTAETYFWGQNCQTSQTAITSLPLVSSLTSIGLTLGSSPCVVVIPGTPSTLVVCGTISWVGGSAYLCYSTTGGTTVPVPWTQFTAYSATDLNTHSGESCVLIPGTKKIFITAPSGQFGEVVDAGTGAAPFPLATWGTTFVANSTSRTSLIAIGTVIWSFGGGPAKNVIQTFDTNAANNPNNLWVYVATLPAPIPNAGSCAIIPTNPNQILCIVNPPAGATYDAVIFDKLLVGFVNAPNYVNCGLYLGGCYLTPIGTDGFLYCIDGGSAPVLQSGVRFNPAGTGCTYWTNQTTPTTTTLARGRVGVVSLPIGFTTWTPALPTTPTPGCTGA